MVNSISLSQCSLEDIRQVSSSLSKMKLYVNVHSDGKEFDINDGTFNLCEISNLADTSIKNYFKQNLNTMHENEKILIKKTIKTLCFLKNYSFNYAAVNSYNKKLLLLYKKERLIKMILDELELDFEKNKIEILKKRINLLNCLIEQNNLKEENVNLEVDSKKNAVQLVIQAINQNNDFDIVFPGGSQQHAVVYGILKNRESNDYTFCVWNTGEGKEKFHNCQDNKYEIKASWSGLSLEKICDEDFLEMLFNKFEIQTKYENIQNHFEKTRDALSETSHLSAGQLLENCEWKSFFACLSDLLGRQKNKRLIFEIKKGVFTTLRTEVLEKIDKKEQVDAMLIKSAKSIENAIQDKIDFIRYNNAS